MRDYGYLLKNINILNIALVIAIYFLAQHFFYPVADNSDKVTASDNKIFPKEDGKPEEHYSPSVSEFTMIAEQNLFHPERKIPPEKQQEILLSKPDLFLYGTLITEHMSIAFVEDSKVPYSTAGRGKRQITVKKGMNLKGYIVSEIEPNRIVLVKDEDRLVVMLDDRQKKRTSEQAGALPVTARSIPGGISHSQAAENPSSRTAPVSTKGVIVQAPDIPGVVPTVPQPEPSSIGPGIGGSGTWPPTRNSVELTRQKIVEGRQKRLEQMQSGQ